MAACGMDSTGVVGLEYFSILSSLKIEVPACAGERLIVTVIILSGGSYIGVHLHLQCHVSSINSVLPSETCQLLDSIIMLMLA